MWHGVVVQFREAEGSLAQLAVFLLGMREPFHQTLLVDKLDTATAFARVVEWLLRRCFAPTYATRVDGLFKWDTLDSIMSLVIFLGSADERILIQVE